MSPSRALALTLLFWLLLLQWNHVDGQAYDAVTSWRSLLQVNSSADAEAFFDGVESSVKSLTEFVLLNYKNGQGLWENGTCSTSCTIFPCRTEALDEKNGQCLQLPANSTALSDQSCTLSNGKVTGCSKARFSTESYVRLPGKPTDLDPGQISPDQQLTICSTKYLDQQIFPTIYENTTGPFDRLAWSMFGASNGVFRIYPGLERNPTLCQQSYDPRKRPWYRAITGVSKQVVILLDGGGLMANGISTTGPETLFEASTTIVSEFLDTLNEDDTVSVYKFGGTDLVLADQSKIRMPEPSDDKAVTNTFAPLRAAMENMSDSITFDAPEANLTAALENLLSLDGGGFDTSNAQILKVILIFTGGKLAEFEGTSISVSSNSPIARALTSLSVRPFIYQWKSSDSTDTDLQSVACSLNASYDVIPRSLGDPLSALQSFYSYVAKIRHLSNQEKPLWIHSYGPFTGVGDGHLVAISYPVFDGDVLLGVAGIDVLQNLPEPWKSVINDRTDDEIVQIPGPPLNCTASLRPAYVPVSGLGNSNGGLCPDGALDPKGYDKRTCCDPQCIFSSSNSGTKFPAGAIAGIAAGSCLLLVFLFCLVYFRKVILEFFRSCKQFGQRVFLLFMQCIKRKKTRTTANGSGVQKQNTNGTSEGNGDVFSNFFF
ncbi:hypothetical protein R1sor_025680 [Riccia sorocarpa]|uniref:VWFA domain-containing protein n=1 Tax=Riccia sorocarpa TaxID=122646 RepID=A0ABD3GAW7_9MARC